MEKVILGNFQASLPHLQVILAHLPENPVTPYVTWLYNKSFPGYAYGNYYQTLEAAQANFFKRCLEYLDNGESIQRIFNTASIEQYAGLEDPNE